MQERVAPSMTERRKEFNIEPALLPPLWEETVAACLAKEAAGRPQSATEVAQRLQLSAPQARAVTVLPTRRPNKRTLAIAGIITLLLVALAGLYFGITKRQGARAAASSKSDAPATAAISEKSIA